MEALIHQGFCLERWSFEASALGPGSKERVPVVAQIVKPLLLCWTA